ncbi:YdeI family protein [Flavobacterium sp.]|uniref:YdeI/OmpD-associated family protein n=1 Tax=Flavobacterium sp. TaxID=239 RepID=UPI0035276BE7
MEDKKTWNRNEQWSDEIELLKSIIAQTELVETTKWGGIVYTWNNRNIIGLGGFKNYFTIWFFNGVFLPDEKNVLVNAGEGVTKGLRQWRFTSKAEVEEKLVLHYVNQAITNEKNGLSIKPEKKTVEPSGFFLAKLNENQALVEQFNAFSPYKQKEFIEYIDSAKQEKTKLDRFEKIKPMLLANIGLNDKYRK